MNLEQLYTKIENELIPLKGNLIYYKRKCEDLEAENKELKEAIKTLKATLRDRDKAVEVLGRVSDTTKREFLLGYAHAMDC